MKIMSLQLKLRLIIVSFIGIIIAIVGFVVYPGMRDIIMLQQEIDKTEAFLESQYQRSRRIAERVGDVDEIVSSTAAFTGLVVPQGSELDSIQTFEALAEKYSIEQKITVAYSAKVHSDTGLPYYTYTFLNHGMMEDHLQYLHDILSQLYIVDIKSVDITRRNTNAGSAQSNEQRNEVTLRFSAIIYAK